MTPILSLWPSAETKVVALKTAHVVREQVGDSEDLFRLEVCHDSSCEDLARKISDSFRRMIKLTATDTVLHIVAVVPVYTADFEVMLGRLTDACESVSDRITLHIVALRESIMEVLESGTSRQKGEMENLKTLMARSELGKVRYSFSLLDNYAANGATFGFDLEGLSEYLARFMVSLMGDYYTVLPPSVLAANTAESLSFGCASLVFDSLEASEYLVRRAFLSVLENSGIHQDTVDAQKAAGEAGEILYDIEERYGQFYQRVVAPLYKDLARPESEIAASLATPMAEEFKTLEKEILTFLDDDKLTMPEKEAMLSLLIGRDNRRLRGVQYDDQTAIIDDGVKVPLDVYIDSFNNLMPESRILPLRGDFNSLKKYEWDDDRRKMKESPDNKRAFNPLQEIKILKSEIQNSTAFIRRKNDEGKALRKLDEDRRSQSPEHEDKLTDVVRRCTTDIKEQPLDEVYVPAEGTRPHNAVDLRKYFSEVRQQGELGSCTTFAIVSIYEAIMNRFSKNASEKANMSEQFVYYFSNVENGRPEGGSNYFEQLAVLGKRGVCRESLFGYSLDTLGHKPSKEAVEDALGHRVLKALQIQLRDTGSAIDCIEDNHKLLTSALSEGYPVGISLKIYDSFGKESPFIGRPDDNDVASGGGGYHAMVLVGYSEEDKCYIVRNSWGKEFGDKGYCYVSASYVDDPQYNVFACIIRETTESEGSADVEEIPQVVSPFAGTESQIKIAAIRNALDEENVRLKALEDRYEELYRYYQQLMQRLCNHTVRKNIRRCAEEAAAVELSLLSERERELQDTLVLKLNEFKREDLKWSLILSGIAFVADIAVGLMVAFCNDAPLLTTILLAIAVVLTLAAVIRWMDRKRRIKRKQRELREEIGQIAVWRDQKLKELLEKKLKYYVAGMWIDNFHDLSMSVARKYEDLVSFNRGLRSWYDDDNRLLKTNNNHDNQIVIYLNNHELLDGLFESRREDIVNNIDLMDTFGHYSSGSETIEESRARLKETTLKAVESLFADFRMVDYLTGNKIYPYVDLLGLEDLITRMLRVGQVATRHNTSETMAATRIVFIDIKDSELAQWRSLLNPCFDFMPLISCQESRFRFDLVSIQSVPLSTVK